MQSWLKMFLSAAAATVLGLAATPAAAGISPNPFRVAAGFENPILLFGFNPQPEPPPAGIVQSLTTTPNAAIWTISGANNPLVFELFFGISAAQFGNSMVPPEPILPTSNYRQLSFDVGTGQQLLTVVVDFSTSSGGSVVASTDNVSFNPQPEPPPSALGDFETFNLEFEFSSLSEAIVSMTVFDAAGNQLNLTQIPEPTALGLFGLGLAGLGIAARRRKTA